MKIGCHFAYTQVGNLLRDFCLVTGLIIIRRIPGHLITLNLLHGSPGFIAVYTKEFNATDSFFIRVLLVSLHLNTDLFTCLNIVFSVIDKVLRNNLKNVQTVL